MKAVMIFDQIQAGAGGKEKANIGLAAKAMPIGSCAMFDPYFKKIDAHVMATLYCGDGYFMSNQEEVIKKMVAMVKKLNPDIVVCGPAFNYENYALMCATLAKHIQEETDIPAIAAFSKENEATIQQFKHDIHIVEMPKKGGIGLSESLANISELMNKIVNKEDISKLVETICYK